MAEKKSAITLSKPEDWDRWKNYIRAEAGNYAGVWEYIDPDVDATRRGQEIQKPAPVSILNYWRKADNTTYNSIEEIPTTEKMPEAAYMAYKQAIRQCDSQTEEYKVFIQGIRKVRTRIIDSIGMSAQPYVEEISHGIDKVPEAMQKLKKTYALEDDAKIRNIQKKFDKLSKGIPRKGSIDTLIAKWETVYNTCKRQQMYEAEGTRMVVAFIKAVRSQYPKFSEYWNNLAIYKPGDESLKDFFEVIRQFRAARDAKLDENSKNQQTDASFSTFQGKSDKPDEGNQKKDGKKKSSPCVACGKTHGWWRCWDINPVAPLRPDQYVVKEETQKKIKDELQKNKNFKRVYKKIQEEARKKQKVTTTTPPATANAVQRVGFACTAYYALTAHHEESYSTMILPLRDSWILDSGSTIHITNSRSQLMNYQPAMSGEGVYAGNQYIPIIGRGDKEIWPTNKHGDKVRFLLTNVAYVPDFHTNLVSFDRMTAAGFYWDTENNYIYTKSGQHVCKVSKQCAQWVMEYNHIEQANAVSEPQSTADLQTWHQ